MGSAPAYGRPTMSAAAALDERKALSVEEYLEGARLSEVRHESFDGQVRCEEGWEPGQTLHDGEFTWRSVGLTIPVNALCEG